VQIAAMNKAELITYVSGFVADLEEAGVSRVTIGSYVKAVKSWARFEQWKRRAEGEESGTFPNWCSLLQGPPSSLGLIARCTEAEPPGRCHSSLKGM
jgi:hypothetical protein